MATTNTRTVKSSGGDYTSLSAWEAGRNADLVAGDIIEIAECYSFDDTTACSVSGWTTDATRYIKITTPIAERHNGKWDATKYRMTGSNYRIYCDGASDVWIQGIQFDQTSVSAAYYSIYFDNTGVATRHKVEKCIFRGFNDVTLSLVHGGLKVQDSAAGGVVKVWDCIFYTHSGGYGMGLYQLSANNTTYAYNNTFYECTYAGLYQNGGTLVAKNNLVNGSGTNYRGTFHGDSITNLSEDSTSPTVALRLKAVTFVNEGAFDLHLDASDTNAKDAGTDLSGDGVNPFSDDIDGDTRSGTWDIGADEIAGTTPKTAALSDTLSAWSDAENQLLAERTVPTDNLSAWVDAESQLLVHRAALTDNLNA